MLMAGPSLRVSGTGALRQMDLSLSLGSAACRLFDLGQHTFSFWASVFPSVKGCVPCLLRQLWDFDGEGHTAWQIGALIPFSPPHLPPSEHPPTPR